MKQSDYGIPRYYSIKTATAALMSLLLIYLAFDILEIIGVVFWGWTLNIMLSIWMRTMADIPIIVIALLCARPQPALRVYRPGIKNFIYSLLLAFFAYIALTVLINFLNYLMEGAGLTLPTEETNEVLFSQPFWVQLLLLCVCAPFTEEILFRGMLQNAYERRYGWLAVLIAGLLFGWTHAEPLSVINGVMMGLLMGYVYIRTRSIWPPIAMHALFNLLALTAIPDIYITNLPWSLGLFHQQTATFADPGYTLYNFGMAGAAALMCLALIKLLKRNNPANVAQKAEYCPQQRGELPLTIFTLCLLALRIVPVVLGYAISAYGVAL